MLDPGDMDRVSAHIVDFDAFPSENKVGSALTTLANIAPNFPFLSANGYSTLIPANLGIFLIFIGSHPKGIASQGRGLGSENRRVLERLERKYPPDTQQCLIRL